MFGLVSAEGATRMPVRRPMMFVADQHRDRRREYQRRVTVDRMLVGLGDADEREAFLRSIRGQSRGATVR